MWEKLSHSIAFHCFSSPSLSKYQSWHTYMRPGLSPGITWMLSSSYTASRVPKAAPPGATAPQALTRHALHRLRRLRGRAPALHSPVWELQPVRPSRQERFGPCHHPVRGVHVPAGEGGEYLPAGVPAGDGVAGASPDTALFSRMKSTR